MDWNPGFNESGAGGFLNNTTNFDSPAGKKKGGIRRLQCVVPVAVRMIQDCQDEEFKLFGTPVQIVSIVGIVTDYDVQSTKATYSIEDHTGRINALWWLENDGSEETPTLPMLKHGSYVRVFGTIRTQENQKNLMVLKMFPIEDANVVTTHMLEVIHTRLQAEVMSKDNAEMIKQNNPGAHLAKNMTTLDENTADNGQLNLTPIQKMVYKYLQADPTAAGPSRTDILAHFPGPQKREASEGLDFLVNEGHAYSTIDHEHFKVTDV